MSSTKKITVDRLKEVLTPDFESGKLYHRPRGLSWWDTRYANKECFTIECHNYLAGTVDKVRLLKHRVLLAMHNGVWPVEVDHINRDTRDNRLENLREVLSGGNQKNFSKMKSNTSGRTGVYFHSRDEFWIAYIGSGQRLGYFKDFDSAVKAREEAEIALGYHIHGDR